MGLMQKKVEAGTWSSPFRRITLKYTRKKAQRPQNIESLYLFINGLFQWPRRWVMVFFWPYDFTYVCPTEIIAFSDNVDKFKELGCDIVGISVDSVYTHRAWINTPRDQQGIGPINYPLASDFKKETAKAYGVLDDASGAAHRGLFIIDPEGAVRYQVVTDMNVGRSVEETLRILEALQSGGLCPVNWKKGDKTLG
ncbi:peroxiredoxin [Paenibacillus sp. TAB 01]|uniref:peroxiredoxin n=1 Tax=Paenibacillus sp. TAB 01 TaxID=3368988 RepID=UPI003750E761